MKTLIKEIPNIEKDAAFYFEHKENCIHESGNEGYWEFRFQNGYKVTVSCEMDYLSRFAGYFQVLVTKEDGEIVFEEVDFDLTDWQTAEQVKKSLNQVASLPAVA